MASFAEIKANTIYFAARTAGERMVELADKVGFGSPLHLQIIKDANLQTAQHTKDFAESANQYYSVYLSSKNTPVEEEARIGLAEQLINLGRFRKARLFLGQRSRLFNTLPENQRFYYQAREEEKFGWIADYEGGYFDSLKHFTSANEILKKIPRDLRGKWGEDLASTVTHFSGRAHFGLASQGIARNYHLSLAITYFEKDLRRFEKLRQEGRAAPANEGFQHAWLARCYLLGNNLNLAQESINQACKLFFEHTENNPESGVLAHFYLLHGKLRLKQGLIDTARSSFEEAKRIRTEVEYYPKGLADALAGLALASWQEHHPLQALNYTAQALKAYPLIVLNGIFGS